MAALQLRAEGTHPEIGIRVDHRGIAFDVATGRPLARKEVDQRVAQYQGANPGVQVAGLVKKRGGVAGVFDRNKKIITPIAEIGAGLLGGPALAAAVGAGIKGLDREGKGGIGLDAGQALRGGVEGGLLGYGAGKVANAIGSQGVLGAAKSGVTKLGGLAKTAGSTLLGGAKELVGGADGVASAGDWLKAGIGAIPAIQGYNRAKDFEKTAKAQVNTASQGNTAMMDIAKALIARGGAGPTSAPDLSGLVDTRNPYYRKPKPMVGAPGRV